MAAQTVVSVAGLIVEDHGDELRVYASEAGARLDATLVRAVYTGIVGWLADRPAPVKVEAMGASPGGDPRLMEGGKEKPRRRVPRKSR